MSGIELPRRSHATGAQWRSAGFRGAATAVAGRNPLGQAYGCHEEEWKLIGGREQPRAVIVASEPLTRDTSTWLEVPEYSLVAFERRAGITRMLARSIEL